jgi:hypothetical protein
MEQSEWDGDNGLSNLFGVYIKHPDDTFCEYFNTVASTYLREPKNKFSSVVKLEENEMENEDGKPKRRALHEKSEEYAMTLMRQFTKEESAVVKNAIKRKRDTK